MSTPQPQGLPSEPKVWLSLTQAQLDWAYDQANHAPNRVDVLNRIAQKSALSRAKVPQALRLSYGQSPIESLDWYLSEEANAPIVFFVHGGAWKSGTAQDNALQVHWLHAMGCHVVIPDFDSVTDVKGDLSHLAAQVERALLFTFKQAKQHLANPQQIIVVGHSSGAHLSACMVTRKWTQMGLESNPIAGLLCCSGMYELEPVSLSARSQYVNFNPEMINDLSPQRHTACFQMPVTLLCADQESPEFIRQFESFAEALTLNNTPLKTHWIKANNHFEVLETLFDEHSVHAMALRALVSHVRG